MIRVFSLKKLLLGLAAVVTAIVLVWLVALTGSAPVFFGTSTRLLPVYSVERADKAISVTFDCAWGVEYTDAILDALQQENVRATFFMVEFWTEKYPEYVKKIDAAGCEIGTHSATHSYMSKLNTEEIRQELKTSSQAITDITGKKVEVFRPPYGDYDDELIRTAGEEGYYSVQWDVDSLDWKDLSAADIALRIIERVRSGSIILLHNNGLHTAEAVPIILNTLKTKGYTFLPVGELIYRENYTIDGTGRQYPVT